LNIFLLWVLIYSVVLIGLGAYFTRRVRQASEFLVAGRRLGGGLLFSTFLAANIGAGSTVGAASLGYLGGWSAWWWVGSAGIGCLILANSVGPRIWRVATEKGLHTVGDYLEYRYNRIVRAVVTLVLWLGSLGLLAAQIIAISVILYVVADLPRWLGTLLGSGVVIFYFAAGGLLSSAWINLLELTVLLAGMLCAAPAAYQAVGGHDGILAAISVSRAGSVGEYFDFLGSGFSGILYYLALLTPSFIVSPGLLQKIYGARSESAVRRGVNANALALLLFAFIPPLIGMVAAARFPGLVDPQLALPTVLKELLPSWLGVLALAAVFSAEISSCDAIMFMLASSMTIDVYKTFLHPTASDRSLLIVSRWSAAVSGILAIGIALKLPSIISALTVFYGLVSVALLVPVVSGLYSKKPDSVAALCAMGASIPCTLLIQIFLRDRSLGIFNPFATGIAVSLVVMWGTTLARTAARGWNRRQQ